MATATTIEERVNALERELEQLKRELNREPEKKNWIEEISGSFADDPDFAEVIRLGREFRQSQPPPELDDNE